MEGGGLGGGVGAEFQDRRHKPLGHPSARREYIRIAPRGQSRSAWGGSRAAPAAVPSPAPPALGQTAFDGLPADVLEERPDVINPLEAVVDHESVLEKVH